MSETAPTLHMLCGKIASGKSTLAAQLANTLSSVLLSEDEWLDALYSDQMSSASDYVRFASKLRSVMGPHISALLNVGVSVVLDFPANRVVERDWMRGILDQTHAHHELHVLQASDELCLARLRARNADGNHPFAATEEQFRQFSSYFETPSAEEGFNIVLHKAKA